MATPLGYYVVFDNPFADVNENNWFYNNMEFVNTGCTRNERHNLQPQFSYDQDMFVTVLHRLPKPDTSGLPQNFTDVAADAYYAEAVNGRRSTVSPVARQRTNFPRTIPSPANRQRHSFITCQSHRRYP